MTCSCVPVAVEVPVPAPAPAPACRSTLDPRLNGTVDCDAGCDVRRGVVLVLVVIVSWLGGTLTRTCT